MRNALSLYDAHKARDKTLVCGASGIRWRIWILTTYWHAVVGVVDNELGDEEVEKMKISKRLSEIEGPIREADKLKILWREAGRKAATPNLPVFCRPIN